MSQFPNDPTSARDIGGWTDDLSASLHRLWEEDRRRAQAEFAALMAPPPKPNRAQRRASRRGER